MDDVATHFSKALGARLKEHEENDKEPSDFDGLTIYGEFPYLDETERKGWRDGKTSNTKRKRV